MATYVNQFPNLGTAPTGVGGDNQREAFAKLSANWTQMDSVMSSDSDTFKFNFKGDQTVPDGSRILINNSSSNACTMSDTAGHRWIWSANGLTAMRIDAFGYVELVQGLKLGGGSGSNVMDDYQKGVFTPIGADASSGGNTSPTTFYGQYIKSGNKVDVTLKLENIDTTGLTAGNAFYIRGLPFANIASFVSVGVVRVGLVTFSGYLTANMDGGNTYMTLMDNTSGANPTNLLVSAISDGTADIYISLTYFTDPGATYDINYG